MISRHSREPEPVSPSLRRLVLAVCVFTWLIRSLYLCLPDRLSLDEDSALHAARYATASEFVNTSNWAERWDTLERVSRQGRVLWIAAHLLWGYAFPSNGGMAYGLTWISALLAMAALAGAARQLFGERGFLLCLLLASLSPLFLNFTVRALGAMPSVACFCAALWLLSAPSWTLPRWVAGGLCLGVAFAIHYGTGVAIVALAAGFGVQIGLYLRLRRLTRHGAGRTVVAASGGTSAAAMGSCCTHYLANVVPVLGATGVVALVAQYQTEFFWLGLVFNAAGTVYVGGKLPQASHHMAEMGGHP